jgi:hypothetical protein
MAFGSHVAKGLPIVTGQVIACTQALSRGYSAQTVKFTPEDKELLPKSTLPGNISEYTGFTRVSWAWEKRNLPVIPSVGRGRVRLYTRIEA